MFIGTPCIRDKIFNYFRTTESVDPTVVVDVEEPLKFDDIVDRRFYDKMRPPKPGGNPTKVMFHVTVLSLDSINEGSMVRFKQIYFLFNILFISIRIRSV